MQDFFLDKFRKKTRQELEQIIANSGHSQKEAIEAAKYIVENNEFAEVATAKPNLGKRERAESQSRLRSFLRTLSYRDFLTVSVMALLALALQAVVFYYSSEDYMRNKILVFNLIIFLSGIISSHVIYRVEHRRSNNYIGRSIFTFVYIIFFVVFRLLYDNLILNNHKPLFSDSIGENILIILVLVSASFILEFLLSMLKYLLKKVRCDLY